MTNMEIIEIIRNIKKLLSLHTLPFEICDIKCTKPLCKVVRNHPACAGYNPYYGESTPFSFGLETWNEKNLGIYITYGYGYDNLFNQTKDCMFHFNDPDAEYDEGYPKSKNELVYSDVPDKVWIHVQNIIYKSVKNEINGDAQTDEGGAEEEKHA